MKAIHNTRPVEASIPVAVVTMSKVVKMKAIHNERQALGADHLAVVTMSKVVKMKAIHNVFRLVVHPDMLL